MRRRVPMWTVLLAAAVGMALVLLRGPSVDALAAEIRAMEVFDQADSRPGCGTNGYHWGYRFESDQYGEDLKKALLARGWRPGSNGPCVTYEIRRGMFAPTAAQIAVWPLGVPEKRPNVSISVYRG